MEKLRLNHKRNIAVDLDFKPVETDRQIEDFDLEDWLASLLVDHLLAHQEGTNDRKK